MHHDTKAVLDIYTSGTGPFCPLAARAGAVALVLGLGSSCRPQAAPLGLRGDLPQTAGLPAALTKPSPTAQNVCWQAGSRRRRACRSWACRWRWSLRPRGGASAAAGGISSSRCGPHRQTLIRCSIPWEQGVAPAAAAAAAAAARCQQWTAPQQGRAAAGWRPPAPCVALAWPGAPCTPGMPKARPRKAGGAVAGPWRRLPPVISPISNDISSRPPAPTRPRVAGAHDNDDFPHRPHRLPPHPGPARPRRAVPAAQPIPGARRGSKHRVQLVVGSALPGPRASAPTGAQRGQPACPPRRDQPAGWMAAMSEPAAAPLPARPPA